jgi:hypothetical protein
MGRRWAIQASVMVVSARRRRVSYPSNIPAKSASKAFGAADCSINISKLALPLLERFGWASRWHPAWNMLPVCQKKQLATLVTLATLNALSVD